MLQVIGEAAGKVSTEYRVLHPEIPWNPIIGLRNRVVHDYPRIELTTVWAILTERIEPLISSIEPLVPPR